MPDPTLQQFVRFGQILQAMRNIQSSRIETARIDVRTQLEAIPAGTTLNAATTTAVRAAIRFLIEERDNMQGIELLLTEFESWKAARAGSP